MKVSRALINIVLVVLVCVANAALLRAAPTFNPLRFSMPGISYLSLSRAQHDALGEIQNKYNRSELRLRKELFPSINWARASEEERRDYRKNVSSASEKFATQVSIMQKSSREDILSVLSLQQRQALTAIDDILAESKRARLAARQELSATLKRPYNALVAVLSSPTIKLGDPTRDPHPMATRVIRYLEREIIEESGVHQLLLDWVVSTEEQRNQINHIRSQYRHRAQSSHLSFSFSSRLPDEKLMDDSDKLNGADKTNDTLAKRYLNVIKAAENSAVQGYFTQESQRLELALLTPDQRKAFDVLMDQCTVLHQSIARAKQEYTNALQELLALQQGKIAKYINTDTSSTSDKQERTP